MIIVSDQAETSQGGVVTPAVREAILRVAAANPQIVVWVDSRRRAEHFRGVIVKPNQEEAEAAVAARAGPRRLPRPAPAHGRAAADRDPWRADGARGRHRARRPNG